MSRKVSGVMAGWLAAVSVAVAQSGGTSGTPPAVKGKTLSPYYATASTVDWSEEAPPELLPPVPSTPVIPAAPAPKAPIQQAVNMQPATPPVPSLPATTPPPVAAAPAGPGTPAAPAVPAAKPPIVPAAPAGGCPTCGGCGSGSCAPTCNCNSCGPNNVGYLDC